jgi:hypothetical protein
MTKNLETADMIVKLAMSAVIIVSYYAGIFTGPFAVLLVVLAVTVVVLTVIKLVIARTRDRR